MGRKSKKDGAAPAAQPFCYYCDREFDDDNVLITHQKARHFKCPTCNKKLVTAQSLMVHLSQVRRGRAGARARAPERAR